MPNCGLFGIKIGTRYVLNNDLTSDLMAYCERPVIISMPCLHVYHWFNTAVCLCHIYLLSFFFYFLFLVSIFFSFILIHAVSVLTIHKSGWGFFSYRCYLSNTRPMGHSGYLSNKHTTTLQWTWSKKTFIIFK